MGNVHPHTNKILMDNTEVSDVSDTYYIGSFVEVKLTFEAHASNGVKITFNALR